MFNQERVIANFHISSQQKLQRQDPSMWKSRAVWKQEFDGEGPKKQQSKTSKASTPLAKEIQLMGHLDQRESNLISVIDRNENYIINNNRALSEMIQEIRDGMNILVHSMQAEMTAVEETMKGQVSAAHTRIYDETDSMRQLTSRYKAMKKMLKDNTNQSIPTRRRSVDLMAQQMPKDDGWTGSQRAIQLRSEVEWQSIGNQFKNQIAKMMNYFSGQSVHDLLESVSIEKSNEKICQQYHGPSEDLEEFEKQMDPRNTVEECSFQMKATKGEEVEQSSCKYGTSLVKKVHFAVNDESFDESSPPSPLNEKEESTKRSGNVNELRNITLDVLCITKDAEIHFCGLKAQLPSVKSSNEKNEKRRLQRLLSAWRDAPTESSSITSHPQHAKHPSIVYHKQSNEVYRFGGVLNGTQLRRSEKYNVLSNQWTALRPDPLARQDALSLLLNNDTIINIGGAAKVRSHQVTNLPKVRKWKFLDELTIYDLQRQNWRQYHQSMKKLKVMQEARYAFAGLSILGKKNVVVFGGNGVKGRISSVEMYDYGANEWKYLEPMPVVKSRHAAVWYGDCAIIAGGDFKSESQKCYQMDLTRNQWMKLPELNQQRSRPVLHANLEKSCVIAAGDSQDLKSVEILDLRVNAAAWMLVDIKSHPRAMKYCAGMIALS